MKLIYFSRDYTPHDHRFLSKLAEHGTRVSFLRLERSGPAREQRALPGGVHEIEWAGGKKPVSFWDGLRLLNSLKRVLRELKPDVVMAGPIQRTAFLTALAGFHPLVSVSWGYDLLFDAQKNRAWDWATRYTLQRSSAMLGDCQTIRDLAVSYGMRPERIVTFPWGVDLAHFSPAAQPKLAAQIFNLLSTRSFEPIYGVDVLARAFVQAAHQRPELRLTLLGEGSQEGLLKKIFAAGKVQDRVNFAGQAGYAELPGCYRSADLYVSASHSDGSSISLLEAMACGAPALVSDIPGNREWVQPGEQGWLFPDGDVDALAAGLVAAYDQRETLPAMGQAARRTVEARADWEKNFPRLLTVLERVCYRGADWSPAV